MYPCKGFLEIYKKDKTFRIQTPETIDPKETNPDVPFIAGPVSDVGSANLIVARVFIQGCELFNGAIFKNNVDKDLIKHELHGIKEDLLVCESIWKNLHEEVANVISEIEVTGIPSERGRVLNPFPHIDGLNEKVASFLVHAKRALTGIGRLPSYYFNIKSRGANFQKLGQQLAQECGEDSELRKFVKNVEEPVKRIVDLRNYQEHPGGGETTEINNFKLTPNNEIQAPSWGLTGEDPQLICEEMEAITYFVMEVAETMHILLLVQNLSNSFPYTLERIAEEDIDPDKPVQIRLSIDPTKLRSPE